MAYTDLEKAKAHLRVDFNDDDEYITDLIDAVENILAVELGEDLENLETEGLLPKGLMHGILLLIKHYYDVREPVVTGTIVAKIPYTLEWIVTVYKNWTIK